MKRMFKYLVFAVLSIPLVAVMAYGVVRSGLEELDQDARELHGGDYLRTEHGTLSYTRQGASDAPTVVLVHGFSTPKFVWEQVTPALVAAGYQVVTYDHFGRGFSDRPPGPYDDALYRGELSALITGLELATPLTLVGYSMGGANVVDYAATYPEHVSRLVLIAPAGYMDSSLSPSVLLAPVLGEWLFTVFGKRFVATTIRAEVDAGRAPADMLDKFSEQAAYRGYTDALLSTLRNYPIANFAHRYQALAATDIPVTAIWGTADAIVPYSGAARMAQDLPGMRLITLEGANHSMTFGRAPEVSDALLDALEARPPQEASSLLSGARYVQGTDISFTQPPYPLPWVGLELNTAVPGWPTSPP